MPADGVFKFLILSAATEVAAITCACLPVIGPLLFKAYKRHHDLSFPYKYHSSETSAVGGSVARKSTDPVVLDHPHLTTTIYGNSNSGSGMNNGAEYKATIALGDLGNGGALTGLHTGTRNQKKTSLECDRPAHIWVEREIEISGDQQPNKTMNV